MGKKKKKNDGPAGAPKWMVTFSDMMTLMLTFFVLLVSMATIDERRRLVVLGSLIGTFGMGSAGFDQRSIKNKRTTIEPGPMEDVQDLQPLKDLIWEDLVEDVNFESNKYVQIVSISDWVFFAPGQTELTGKGRKVLNLILPLLLRIKYPLLLAGHSSSLRDETPDMADVELDKKKLDPSWKLSFFRMMSIYQYLIARGISPEMLRVEAFGRFRPKYSDNTPEGRRRNRRVDIVLDKRNKKIVTELGVPKTEVKEGFSYKDFDFNIKVPTPPGEERF